DRHRANARARIARAAPAPRRELSCAADRNRARGSGSDLLRRVGGRRLHYRRVARHQRRRPDDVAMKESTRVLLAVTLAIAGGIAIAATHNTSLARAADFIAPFGTLWVDAIRMTVIPLVVSLLIIGVASAADIKSVGRIGGRTLLVFLGLLVGVAVVVMPLSPALFTLLPHGATQQLP